MEVSVIVAMRNGDTGISTDVAILDPSKPVPEGLIDKMAKKLHSSTHDLDFNWDEKRVTIPESLLKPVEETRGFKMIHPELKKAIVEWLFENPNVWNRLNACHEQFRPYIYDAKGSYLIGGEEVSEFIHQVDKLIND